MAFSILKVEEKHKAGQASFEEVEQDIMNETDSTEIPAPGP